MNKLPTEKVTGEGLEDLNITGNPPPGEELDAFTNDASKKKKPYTPGENIIENPLNPGLNSSNDK